MLYYPGTLMEVEVLRDWVRQRLDVQDPLDDGYAMAIVRPLDDGDANILAAFVFSNHNGANVFLSGASEVNGFVSPTEVAKALMTPFLPPLSVLRLTALVSETNKRSRALMEHLGFVHEGTLRDFQTLGSRTLVFGLTKADFFGGKYGHRCQATAEQYKSSYFDDCKRESLRRDVRGHDGRAFAAAAVPAAAAAGV
jgi:RimJ/RimL family protein N-acetyltransferase